MGREDGEVVCLDHHGDAFLGSMAFGRHHGSGQAGVQGLGGTGPCSVAADAGPERSYRPDELFDDAGRRVPELLALPPAGARRMSAYPVANGGTLVRDMRLPD